MNDSEAVVKSAAEIARERAARLAGEAPTEAPRQDTSAAAGEGAGEAAATDSEQMSAAPSSEEVRALQDELAAAKDRYLRLAAEFDNYRRRTARETLEAGASTTAAVLTDLLPVLDNFDRALAGAPAEGDWAPSDPAGFAKGVRMIRAQMRRLYESKGVVEIPALGEPFNHDVHDAVTQLPDPGVPAGHVSNVIATGWKMGERILRHAQVVVSSGAPEGASQGGTSPDGASENGAAGSQDDAQAT